MKLRLCIFGNSHLAALRSAWKADPDRWTAAHITMVGAHKNGLMETEHRDGKLVPTTDHCRAAFRELSNLDAVDLGAFDAFAVVGGQLSLDRLAVLYREARWTELPSLQNSEDIAMLGPRLVSKPAFTAALAANMRSSLGAKFTQHLRQGTDKPIYFASQPRMSAAAADIIKTPLRALSLALSNGDAPFLSQMFNDTARDVLAPTDATFLAQPNRTITNHILTKKRFTNGSERLNAGGGTKQPETDVIHANQAYGRIILDQILRSASA